MKSPFLVLFLILSINFFSTFFFLTHAAFFFIFSIHETLLFVLVVRWRMRQIPSLLRDVALLRASHYT